MGNLQFSVRDRRPPGLANPNPTPKASDEHGLAPQLHPIKPNTMLGENLSHPIYTYPQPYASLIISPPIHRALFLLSPLAVADELDASSHKCMCRRWGPLVRPPERASYMAGIEHDLLDVLKALAQ
jgi:hypothetical protein